MDYAFFILTGYLLGSIMFAWYLPLFIKQVDIREVSDDGNPGTANAFKHAGVFVGILVIVCELGKGFVPVFLARRYLKAEKLLFSLVMAAPVIGHAFPVFTKGKEGGKAIAVSFGVLLGLLPEWRPVLVLVFYYLLFSLFIVIKPHLHRSIVTFIFFTASCVFFVKDAAVILGCALISAVVVLKHLKKYQGESVKVALLGNDFYRRRD